MAKILEDLILNEDPDTIAGFVAEPVQGAGGVIPPSKNYFNLIQPILKKYNIPFIADEVICGFGRTGNLWGSETYNIDPDIIIASKCITAGFFPMGAIIITKEFAEEFVSISENEEEFPHGFTAGGHPVGCAIALKAIDVIINEGLLDNVRYVSPYFHERLNEFNSYEHIGETRGIGLMAALEMVKNKHTKEPFESHLNIGDKIANMSIDNGLICRPLGSAIVLCPQFIITKGQIDQMFDSLHKTIKQAFN
jgi:Adenosylmethionine-8-amino-7-oxononanoate aminotransferase